MRVRLSDDEVIEMTMEEYVKFCDEHESKKKERENDRYNQMRRNMYYQLESNVLSSGNVNSIENFRNTH